MQQPSLGDLNFFDTGRWSRCDHQKDVEFSIIGVDAGNTQTATGSYSAFVCLGVCDKRLKVLGVRRGRWASGRSPRAPDGSVSGVKHSFRSTTIRIPGFA
jgi:hypothetical protein